MTCPVAAAAFAGGTATAVDGGGGDDILLNGLISGITAGLLSKVPGARLGAPKSVASVPNETAAVIRSIQKDGVIVQEGVEGPSVPRSFANDGRHGGQLLPTKSRGGGTITYREWGTVPAAGNMKPGGKRIVTGSDGSIFYSPDHYQTFVRWGR